MFASNWLNQDDLWLSFTGSALLIIVLYVIKALLLRFTRKVSLRIVLFAIAVLLCVPATWALSTDWNNRHVFRIAIYFGNPMATLFVPCLSFLVDCDRREADWLGGWFARLLVELLICVPAWFYLWIFIEVFVLQWVWI